MELSRKFLLGLLSNRFVGEQERIIIRHLIDAQDRIVELEAKLAALDWTPITAGNLPKGPSGDYAGDEFLEVRIRDTDNFSITIVLGDWDSGWLQERPVYYQYRRPINPPQEPK